MQSGISVFACRRSSNKSPPVLLEPPRLGSAIGSARSRLLFTRFSSFCSCAQPRYEEGEALRIDGRAIAEEIKVEIASCVEHMKSRLGVVPGLATLRVGNSHQSQAYVQKVEEACSQVGIASRSLHFSSSTTRETVLAALRSLNTDEAIHGIIVQLPLPQTESVLREICIHKDVDGLHPLNLGRLAAGIGEQPSFVPCTPLGCLELLSRHKIQLERKHAVVLGCSNVVGLPTALLLQRHNATVTIVDKYTLQPAEITRQADILVSATGNANLVRGDWIKPGAVVIDVGMNMVEDHSTEDGYKFLGDVCFEEAKRVASAITPVPGGVGPMTVAMLLRNTLESALKLVPLYN